MSKNRKSGADDFESYYCGLFGSRWQALRASLLESPNQVAWQKKMGKPYFLDQGSVEAALALPPCVSGKVLDMCAAPGGKTLILAGNLDEESVLTANEISRERKNRLVSVLDQHLEPEIRKQVTVTCRDASRWSRFEQNAYDRILLDAPCSSERHVLSSPAYLAEWSPARIRNLASRQWALLSGAFLVLKEGGYIVYSTCALATQENDGVVERLLKKYPTALICDPLNAVQDASVNSKSEKTAYGRHVLPDTSASSGPLFYALIKKT